MSTFFFFYFSGKVIGRYIRRIIGWMNNEEIPETWCANHCILYFYWIQFKSNAFNYLVKSVLFWLCIQILVACWWHFLVHRSHVICCELFATNCGRKFCFGDTNRKCSLNHVVGCEGLYMAIRTRAGIRLQQCFHKHKNDCYQTQIWGLMGSCSHSTNWWVYSGSTLTA